MPSPGDLIEISRGNSLGFVPYSHWAVYVGVEYDGYEYVVHLVNLDNSSGLGTHRGKVRKQKLKDVVGNNRWKVNNEVDKKRRPRPAQEIVDDALSMVGDDVKFSVVEGNCENFATWLRSGKGHSDQVDNTATAVASTIGGVFGVVGGPIGMAVGAAAGAGIMKLSLAIGEKFS